MRDAFVVFNRKWISRVTIQRNLRQQWDPLDRFVEQLGLTRQSVERRAFKRTLLRIVAAKITRVDHYPANNTRQAQTNDAPIKTRRTPAPTLPPIHPLAAVRVLAFDKDRRTRLQQVLFRRKKIIIGDEHRATHFFRSEIDQVGEVHIATKRQKRHKSGKNILFYL